MGKPSLHSRKTAWRRQKKRQYKKFKQKEIEISDLQIQLQDFQKAVETAGEQEEEIYKLELKSYLAQSSSSLSSPPQPPSSSSSSQLSPTSFKSMDEYFKHNQ
ncbi:unnamed protein product [Rhizophagus irregularis]|nr:unnamed protein product [Rhizophagus irregularis]